MRATDDCVLVVLKMLPDSRKWQYDVSNVGTHFMGHMVVVLLIGCWVDGLTSSGVYSLRYICIWLPGILARDDQATTEPIEGSHDRTLVRASVSGRRFARACSAASARGSVPSLARRRAMAAIGLCAAPPRHAAARRRHHLAAAAAATAWRQSMATPMAARRTGGAARRAR